MEFYLSNSLVWLISLLSLILFLIITRKSCAPTRVPPGPPGWPILGNLLDLGTMPHRTLAGLAKTYGPVIWLKLGAVNTVVVLSATAAGELFRNHDLAFVERSINETSRVHDYHKGSLALAPYGPYWRVLRRLLAVDMLVVKRITETVSVRRKCVDDMLVWIEEEGEKGGGGIQVSRFVFLMTFNLLGNLMLSRDIVDPKSNVGSEFFGSMRGLMEWSGYANLADYFPWLKRFDPQGLGKKMDRDLGKALEIASTFLKERLEERQFKQEIIRQKDFLDILLDFEGNGKDEPDRFSGKELSIFILEIFMAGTETTSSSMEWALTELLLNPESMNKLKSELHNIIGRDRKLEESDIDNLPYLQAVVKETLRLHPPIPFLVPRKAVKDTCFMGYDIPKHTQLLVNAWAIGRDPDVWDDPMSFKPERFIGSKVDYKGQSYEYIPFGAGRRICAGIPLAHRVLHLVLGSLVHEFDWKLEEIGASENMDMNDTLGITMRKSMPLVAVPKKCR